MVIGFEYPFKTRVYRMWVSHAAHFIVYSCEWFWNKIGCLTRERSSNVEANYFC